MNQHLESAIPEPIVSERQRRSTRAAEGLDRLAFTADDLFAMVKAGILKEDDRVELVDGEIVVMAAKGNRHELVKFALLNFLYAQKPDNISVIPETTYRFSDSVVLEPDITLFWRSAGLANLAPDNTLLIIEVADTSLRYDKKRKAAIYAHYGIKEYWVVDAVTLTTEVFKEPSPEGYKKIQDKAAGDLLTPEADPSLAVRLADLDLR
ncbi:MAG: Uma2 family endonuclease [Hyphomicrobiales bacterium]|nr:Uma2 family endonuclease [Hyphomicrobiales bacterium]